LQPVAIAAKLKAAAQNNVRVIRPPLALFLAEGETLEERS
jgi:hypothetical protein